MAIIPPDAAIRLRMQTEESLSPVAPLKAIPGDPTDLRQGQTFTARILQPQPDNTYRALVAGKEITLSLPETAKTGDILELVVVERSARMVTAQLSGSANPLDPAANSTTENNTQISTAGQMIGKLLLPAGEAPQPVSLNQGIPLLKPPLPSAADLAAALAPRLEQAATQSGLFYEAHQALWLSGQHSTAALMEEPQARQGLLDSAKFLIGKDITIRSENSVAPVSSGKTAAQQTTGTGDAPSTAVKDPMQSIPAELRPLVQQQLDAASSQRLVWQGEVWPGQTMQWQISREPSDQTSSGSTQEVSQQWNTTLALTTPTLGRIEAALNIAGNTVKVRLAASSAESVSKLNSHLARLQSALEAAGLQPVGIQVRDGNT